MTDWPLIGVRLALYGDLGLLFGIPLFALHTPTAVSPRRLALLYAALSLGGAAFSVLGFGLLVASMTSASVATLDMAMVETLFRQTAVGTAFAARLAALALVLFVALFLPSTRAMTWLVAGLGGIALGSLAWNGHGVAGEGPAGYIRLCADIVHMLAASAWIGALAMLLHLVSPRAPIPAWRLDAARKALKGFAAIGSVLVALIALTGLANAAFILGLDGLSAWPSSPYVRLLLLKLASFAAMLGCAALNRFWLVPRLEAQGRLGLPALRLCIAFESIFALAVLALVAWLGTLEPG